MRKLLLAALAVLALAVPAQASASVLAMEPSESTAKTLGEAIVAIPTQLTEASLPEWPFDTEVEEEEEFPWPVGIGTTEAPPPIG